ncbi:hypothetical protein COB21_02290 [Candidatus Aerophobetes bacterium]|uniref:Uncharacterized protein n=1 Tax=Aerophobetes bacterium TaxID=2030807 RepID=A0A2A4X782_UNCAE|nr:MAG: hypothetical protein COB21_02290 [Candidatus Aerophobetes bacterium]
MAAVTDTQRLLRQQIVPDFTPTIDNTTAKVVLLVVVNGVFHLARTGRIANSFLVKFATSRWYTLPTNALIRGWIYYANKPRQEEENGETYTISKTSLRSHPTSVRDTLCFAMLFFGFNKTSIAVDIAKEVGLLLHHAGLIDNAHFFGSQAGSIHGFVNTLDQNQTRNGNERGDALLILGFEESDLPEPSSTASPAEQEKANHKRNTRIKERADLFISLCCKARDNTLCTDPMKHVLTNANINIIRAERALCRY